MTSLHVLIDKVTRVNGRLEFESLTTSSQLSPSGFSSGRVTYSRESIESKTVLLETQLLEYIVHLYCIFPIFFIKGHSGRSCPEIHRHLEIFSASGKKYHS